MWSHGYSNAYHAHARASCTSPSPRHSDGRGRWGTKVLANNSHGSAGKRGNRSNTNLSILWSSISDFGSTRHYFNCLRSPGAGLPLAGTGLSSRDGRSAHRCSASRGGSGGGRCRATSRWVLTAYLSAIASKVRRHPPSFNGQTVGNPGSRVPSNYSNCNLSYPSHRYRSISPTNHSFTSGAARSHRRSSFAFGRCG